MIQYCVTMKKVQKVYKTAEIGNYVKKVQKVQGYLETP